MAKRMGACFLGGHWPDRRSTGQGLTRHMRTSGRAVAIGGVDGVSAAGTPPRAAPGDPIPVAESTSCERSQNFFCSCSIGSRPQKSSVRRISELCSQVQHRCFCPIARIGDSNAPGWGRGPSGGGREWPRRNRIARHPAERHPRKRCHQRLRARAACTGARVESPAIIAISLVLRTCLDR